MSLARTLITTFLVLTVTMSTAHAFDANRAGFQAGFGLGAHTSAIDNVNTFSSTSVESTQKPAADVQLGYGFSEKIVGFIGGKGGTVVVGGRKGSLAISGLGSMIYLSENAPSLYLTGLIGLGSLSLQDENAELDDTGAGWLAGVGYELTKGLHLELSYAKADLVDPWNKTSTSAMESTFATVKYLWY